MMTYKLKAQGGRTQWEHLCSNRKQNTTKLFGGEGHFKSLLFFLSSPIASKHSAFSLIEVSASEVPAALKKFVWKEVISKATILNCTWQSGRVFMWHYSVRLKIGGKEKNLQPILHPSQGRQNVFLQAIIYLLSSLLSFSRVWSMFGSK